MSGSFLVRYVSPWTLKRQRAEQQRVAGLRARDGDSCRRCRRPMRFDLPAGHDLGPRVEQIVPQAEGEEVRLDNLCLTHRRCNAEAADNTPEVTERIRRKNEAELFANARQRVASQA